MFNRKDKQRIAELEKKVESLVARLGEVDYFDSVTSSRVSTNKIIARLPSLNLIEKLIQSNEEEVKRLERIIKHSNIGEEVTLYDFNSKLLFLYKKGVEYTLNKDKIVPVSEYGTGIYGREDFNSYELICEGSNTLLKVTGASKKVSKYIIYLDNNGRKVQYIPYAE